MVFGFGVKRGFSILMPSMHLLKHSGLKADHCRDSTQVYSLRPHIIYLLFTFRDEKSFNVCEPSLFGSSLIMILERSLKPPFNLRCWFLSTCKSCSSSIPNFLLSFVFIFSNSLVDSSLKSLLKMLFTIFCASSSVSVCSATRMIRRALWPIVAVVGSFSRRMILHDSSPLGAVVRTSQPSEVTRMSSSIRTPPMG
jgi:hypothetical protein